MPRTIGKSGSAPVEEFGAALHQSTPSLAGFSCSAIASESAASSFCRFTSNFKWANGFSLTVCPKAPIVRAQPAFESAEAERRHRKERLAGGFRILSALGFSEGVSGHVTARDPEFTDTFWVNPFGMNLGLIRVSDLIRVDARGDVVEGARPVNVSAFAIHYQIHEARPDVVAAAHLHSIYGRAWSAVGRLLDPVTRDACAFYEDHVFFDDDCVVITEASEGAVLAGRLGPHKAAILRNHGLITVGQTVEAAIWWFISMERACQTQFMAESVGTPLQIDPGNARATRAINGSSFAGWFQFQPLWDRIVKEQPDLLD